ncbi:conserved exported hypothetical protein [Hyphomicrobiales bacterium]|jgi:hypothetical protein|nr:conserved exported hypothetical protein [Hyphomicrobiales bacterium]CAH1686915.1 conserved exported hypothetical protein [Hyphomicrobiales bacterium]
MPGVQRSAMKTSTLIRRINRIRTLRLCVRIAVIGTATVGPASASDAPLSAALLAAKCPAANIEEAYKSDAVSVFKVDCKGLRVRRVIATCTRTACSVSSEPGDDAEDRF